MSEAIKAQIKEAKSQKGPAKLSDEKVYSGTAGLLLEQTLNKLFYVQPDYEKELEMLKFQKAQAQQRGDRVGLHCSAIIVSENEFCYRQQVLSLFFKQLQGEQISLHLKRIFKEGDYIGEKWQRLFISGGLGIKEDMDVSRRIDKYDLSYTPDAEIIVANTKWVVETKSMNTFSFKKADSHPSGRKQLRMYMFFERIKHGFVLAEDKNDQQFKVFIEVYGETFTKDDILPYIERLEGVQSYKQEFIQTGKMVKRHPDCTSPTCKRASKCSMRDACFNCGMGRIKL